MYIHTSSSICLIFTRLVIYYYSQLSVFQVNQYGEQLPNGSEHLVSLSLSGGQFIGGFGGGSFPTVGDAVGRMFRRTRVIGLLSAKGMFQRWRNGCWKGRASRTAPSMEA